MDYLATFHTNFDAMAFLRMAKTMGTAKMKPVPRKLSSSCGTCVMFTPTQELQEDLYNKWEFEKLYQIDGDEFTLLSENE